jgi:hypothetical protein
MPALSTGEDNYPPVVHILDFLAQRSAISDILIPTNIRVEFITFTQSLPRLPLMFQATAHTLVKTSAAASYCRIGLLALQLHHRGFPCVYHQVPSP